MKLQQLRFLCEIVDRELSISNAAAALHTSQPSVSRQIQALEKELGVAVFARSRKRILGLTKPGIEVLQIARRMVRDAENLSQVGNEFTAKDSGDLVITTSHTHARYVLPSVIKKFAAEYPKVRVILRQGNPTQIAEWASSGDADLSISSEPIRPIPNLVLLPCYDHPKVVLTPLKHPLLGKRALTIEELARSPLITYDSEFATHAQVMRAFESRQLKPNIILSATDVDVMKTYVKHGMGVAIVASLAYDAKEDRALRSIDARHLFESNKIYVGIRRHSYLRGYVFRFIRLFSPKLTREIVERAVFASQPRE
ncbi:MAG: CysB family HTH-type transcriptional regulator [Proteobacteria bacterium]|nr:CysB family HTH-type transcriptional regulator [Pseudomonadota bacterium]